MFKKAFTLVELIVVITILAILGTISFISISGYAKGARDSRRTTNIRSIHNKIQIANVKGTHISNLINNEKTNLVMIEGKLDFSYQGSPNYKNLLENGNNFKDPIEPFPDYIFAYAQTKLDDGSYMTYIQGSTVDEETNTAIVIGNYSKLKDGDSESLITGVGDENLNRVVDGGTEPPYDVGVGKIGSGEHDPELYEIWKFYNELRQIESAVLGSGGNYAGKQLEYGDSMSIKGINFAYGWHFLTTSEVETIFGIDIDDSRQKGFIVNYSTGEVFSVDGKIINLEVVHSINYKGVGYRQLYLTGILTGVSGDSTKNNTTWGELLISPGGKGKYAGTGNKQGFISGNEIAEFTLDQTRPVNHILSANATIDANIPQNFEPAGTYGRTVFAISKDLTFYLVWVSIYGDYLHIYTFNKTTALKNINYEVTQKGFISRDISSYKNNKYLNIQVVAERGGMTKVYLNGDLFEEFESGNDILDFPTITVGDLRKDRNLKFEGNIYNFALYGILLREEAVKHNRYYTKYQLGISN